MKKTWIITASAILGILIVGIAIPKLTVHDAVSLTEQERSCAETGIRQQFASPIQRIALALGKSAVVEKAEGHNTIGVRAYTLYRIPLGTAYLLNMSNEQIGIICDWTKTDQTEPTPVFTAEVPEGWYFHQVGGYDGSQTILTKTKDLPNVDSQGIPYGEHIAIVERDISLTPPDQYVERNVSVSGPTVQFATWGTLFGRKMLSIGFTDPNDNSRQQYTYLFGGGKFVLINLYPDKQENRAAFQQVVNYYAQTLPMIPRDETLATCKIVVFTPGQERNAHIDPETGYVTAEYTKDGKLTTAFFNYNDDLSQCLPDIAEFLRSVKEGADKMTQ